MSGNPATIVRYRFDEVTVQRLLAVRWWDWPEQRILALGHKLLSPDINGFLDAAEAGEPASTPARCAIRSVE